MTKTSMRRMLTYWLMPKIPASQFLRQAGAEAARRREPLSWLDPTGPARPRKVSVEELDASDEAGEPDAADACPARSATMAIGASRARVSQVREEHGGWQVRRVLDASEVLP